MARCEITSFTIGGLPLVVKKSDKEATTFNPDRIVGYTVTECTLVKELLSPHEFTFVLRRDTIAKTDDFKHYGIIKNILGQKVKCEVTAKPDANVTSRLTFNGVIDKVSMKGLNLICVAHSPDADMQGTPKCRCFTNVKLEDVLNSTVPGSLNKIVGIHDYAKNSVFPYIVQYNENDYDFLVRLAKRFGAFMYFDNSNLVFGKIPAQPNQTIFQRDIKNYSYSASYELQTGDPNFQFEAYHYEEDLELEGTGTGYNLFSPDKNQLLYKAIHGSTDFEASDYYIDDPLSHPNAPQVWEDDLSTATLGSDLYNLATCTFTTYLVDLEVGNVVTINDNGPMLITSLNLTWDCDGTLSNEVTAKLLPHENMNPDHVYPPYMDFNAYPKSSAQRAVVINNVDPKKMGRVRVRFIWQKNPTQAQLDDYPWIRIAQPYGGNEKGCYILPEIGEEVMVGFEHDNMEKPFVIGTLYHDSEQAAEKQMPDESWVETTNPVANKGNEVKAFRTKKGHTIEFHDVDGAQNYGYLRIYNSNKPADTSYEIVLSTDPIQVPAPADQDPNHKDNYKTVGPKTEQIDAGKDIEDKTDYEASKLRLMVRSHGGDIVLDAGTGDIIMNAANIRVHATGDATTLIDHKNIIKVKEGQFADLAANSQVVQGKQTIVVKGEDTEEYRSKLTFKADKDVEMKSLSPQSTFNLIIDAKSLSSDTQEKTEIKSTQTALLKATTGLDLQGGSQADLKAASIMVEATADATLKGATTTVEGTAASSLKTEKNSINITPVIGGRSGNWGDS